MKFSRLTTLVPLLVLPCSGCVILRHQMLLKIQQQHQENLRLAVIAVICMAVVPIAAWIGLVWGTKTATLRSWRILLVVEICLLLCVGLAHRYFGWVALPPEVPSASAESLVDAYIAILVEERDRHGE